LRQDEFPREAKGRRTLTIDRVRAKFRPPSMRRDLVTHAQRAALQLEMSRRLAVAGVVQFCLFLVFYYATPFPLGRPPGTDAALSVLALTVVLRALLWRFDRTGARGLARSKLLFRAVVMLGALTWGLLTASTVLEYGVTPASSVILLFVFGIAILSLQNFGLDLVLVRAFVVAITGPGALALLLDRRSPGAFSFGCGYLMYAGFLLFLAGRAHAVLREALSSRTTIQDQRDRLTAVLDALPGFVIWIDEGGSIMGLNEKLATAYHARASDIVGTPLEALARDPEIRAKIASFRASARTEELLEAQITRPSGARWTLLALKKYGEEDRELLVIGLDIDDRKRAESERDQARASATEAARLAELGVMAAGIGHEINNPLQALNYALGILQRHLDTPSMPRETLEAEGRRLVDRAKATVQRIAAIVQGLRSFAHEEKEAELAPVDLSAMVRELGDLGGATLSTAGVALHLDVPSEAVTIRARRAQIGQVLMNLLNNARDAVEAAPEKWVRVGLRDLGDAVEIGVEDSGPGIAPPLREQMMVPFFTTKGVGRGTGLGLSISKAIVDHHRGRLYLDPSSTHTRFVVVLPKDPDRAAA
jgi:signal transduction histidine kinase